MEKLTPIMYLVIAALLAILAIASLVAMILSLTVQDTLAAVESALGTGVLTILLAVMANKVFKAGWRRLHPNAPPSSK